MADYLFSIRPRTYEQVKEIFKRLNEIFEKKWDVLEESEGIKLIQEDDALHDKLLDKLLGCKERHEELYEIKHELYECVMVLDFKFYFREDYSLPELKDNPASPEAVREYWDKLKIILKDEKAKWKAVKHHLDNTDIKYKKEDVGDVFDRWITILKHAAEHGNWYYCYVGGP